MTHVKSNETRERLTEETRESWNHATRAHNSHKRDQAAFFRDGGSTLFPEELELLGDVRGKALLHLQCNAGQDTLSLARLGARVTGVDLSDEAIAFATSLARAADLEATFVRADVYDWLEEAARLPARFDLAFASYGALPWLSDLDAWVRGVAAILSPGGRLVLVEFHPIVWSIDASFRLVGDDYFAEGRPFSEPVKDYVGAAGPLLAPSGFEAGSSESENPHVAHAFQWTLGDVVTSVARAGLSIDVVREYPHANGCRLIEGLVETEGRRLVPPPGIARIPLMFGIAARLV